MKKLNIFLIFMLMAIFVTSVCAQEMDKKAENKEKTEKMMKIDKVKKIKAEQKNEREGNEESEEYDDEDDDDNKSYARDMMKMDVIKIRSGQADQDVLICPFCMRKMKGNEMPPISQMQMDMMKMTGNKEMMGQMMQKMMDKPEKTDFIGMKMGMVKSIIGHANEIKLTEDQRSKIDGILIANQKDMVRKNADREITDIDLGELLKKDDPDPNAVKAQIQKLADIESDIKFTQIKVWMDAKAVLTDDQKATLKKLQMQDERGPKMQITKFESEKPNLKEMKEQSKSEPGSEQVCQ
jgi:Spy/CpxP family protein refolding chaperone